MSLPATDNFNRADANPIGGNWTTLKNQNAIKLVSNQATSTSATSVAYWNADVFNANQYSQVKYTGSIICGPGVRLDSSGATSKGYLFEINSPNHKIWKNLGSGWVSGGADVTHTINIGDVIKLAISGSPGTLEIFVNGVSIATRSGDAAITSGAPGIYCFTSKSVDDWEGGNLDSGVSGTLTGTLANLTGDMAGAHGVAGTAGGTLGNVTGAMTGQVRAEGPLTGTLGKVTGAFSGEHGVAGSVAGTLATATGVFSGAHGVAGTEAGTLPTLTGGLAGVVRAEGSLAGTLGNLTGSIDGKFWPPEVTGETVCILPNLIGDFHGKFWPPESEVVIGTFAGTLPNLAGNLVGTFTELSAKWKFPTLFSDSGFQYGDYDPGQAAAIASGCLHIYMKTGDARAGTWARRILDDLRVNRQDQDYGGYMSDRHYGWLIALVLQTFGLGVNGVPGQSYRFPAITEDRAHFDALISWIMARAGDEKPNVLNSDLIPFTFSEAGDMWSYAPNYLAMGPMGSLEAVVLMLGGALERGKIQGDWDWFNRLLAFMVRDNLVVLSPAQIRTVTAACDQAGAANLVRLRYADYDRDGSKYFEARDQAAIDNWGEQALDLDFRYGSPVILEDPGMARLLCTRLLQRLAPPLEAAEVETWLEGVRIELGDTVAVSSDFHGWDREEFTVLGKNLDLGRRRVHLKLSRTMDYADSWAVDAAGSAFDAWAIDLDSSWDDHWDSRTYVY